MLLCFSLWSLLRQSLSFSRTTSTTLAGNVEDAQNLRTPTFPCGRMLFISRLSCRWLALWSPRLLPLWKQVEIQLVLQSGNEIDMWTLCALHEGATRAETFARSTMKLRIVCTWQAAFHHKTVHRKVRIQHSQVHSLRVRIIIARIDAGRLQSLNNLRFGHKRHVDQQTGCGLLHGCFCWLLLIRGLASHHPESGVAFLHAAEVPGAMRPVLCRGVLAQPTKSSAAQKGWPR